MKDSKIEWTHSTFNPWHGCTRVSPGCDHCYAETLSTRWGRKIWGPDSDRLFFGDKHWAEPLKWNADAINAGERRRVFCGSMCDWAEGRPDQAEARGRLFALIEATPGLDWLLLTKRPGAIRHLVPAAWLETAPANVWYGTSVENQEQADRRIPQLLRVPAVVRFLSCEPLLAPVNLDRWFGLEPGKVWAECLCNEIDPEDRPCLTCEGRLYFGSRSGLDWIIAGGESGPGARPMHPDWARGLRDQCQAAGVAYHFKQWGNWAPKVDHPSVVARDGNWGALSIDGTWSPETTTWNGRQGDDEYTMVNIGKKAAGRLLDERTWDDFPEVLV